VAKNRKGTGAIGLRVVLLAVILAFCWLAASSLLGISAPSPEKAADAVWILVGVSLAEAAVLAYLILRSRGAGWKLVGAVFLAFFGLNTAVSQLESLVYLAHRLPPSTTPKLFAVGAITAGVFSPVAVAVLGKMRGTLVPPPFVSRLAMPWGEWVWRLAVIAGGYVLLHFTLGYYLAWANPAVREFYGGTQAESFLAQIAHTWATAPWIFPFQGLRALLWTAFSLPMIGMHPGRRWEVTLATALLFSVWSLQLLLPNPYMPEAVAKTYLVEAVPSNLLFGALVGLLLGRSRRYPPPFALSSRGFGLVTFGLRRRRRGSQIL
jgi:hypothetical protein